VVLFWIPVSMGMTSQKSAFICTPLFPPLLSCESKMRWVGAGKIENKPNFKLDKMDISSFMTSKYEGLLSILCFLAARKQSQFAGLRPETQNPKC
jgi:hypothetical protein